ncbi:hypothetical protein BDA96_03G214900, partial [Sorghum bicolor]
SQIQQPPIPLSLSLSLSRDPARAAPPASRPASWARSSELARLPPPHQHQPNRADRDAGDWDTESTPADSASAETALNLRCYFHQSLGTSSWEWCDVEDFRIMFVKALPGRLWLGFWFLFCKDIVKVLILYR